ncbi:MAG: iron-containing alcohol dehydrogenase [Smithellaceae bacterium]
MCKKESEKIALLDFTFHNPTKIIFGRDSIRKMTAEIPPNANVMITFGSQSAKRYGVLDDVRKALAGCRITEFGGIEPNPEYETLLDAVRLARQTQVNFLVAIGGGSVIDGAKFIAAAIPFEGEPARLLNQSGKDITCAFPLGAVVTLPASGSEMNSRAVISRKALRTKQVIINDHLFPQFAVLDPTRTFTLPAKYVGNGVVDTFVHVLEQYLTYPVGGHVQDRLAEALLQVLIEDGPKALTDPENYDVRANLMWAATLGLNGLIGSGVPQDWAAHRAGYELTVMHGLDHAQTLALLVPAMMKVRAAGKRKKLLQYACRIWGIEAGDEAARIDAAVEKTRAFFEGMGVPTRLSDYGINDFNAEHMIMQLQAHGMDALGENKDVTPDVMRDILACCL